MKDKKEINLYLLSGSIDCQISDETVDIGFEITFCIESIGQNYCCLIPNACIINSLACSFKRYSSCGILSDLCFLSIGQYWSRHAFVCDLGHYVNPKFVVTLSVYAISWTLDIYMYLPIICRYAFGVWHFLWQGSSVA